MAKKAKTEDFVTQLMDVCVIAKVPGVRAVKEKKDKDGNITQEAVEGVKMQPARCDTQKLADLAANNSLDGEKYREAEPKDAGRARMTIGNMLRAAAKRRHGLFDVNGDWVGAPADFLADCPEAPTETPQGVKIPKAKAEPETEETPEG